jgi:type II secretory pathway predicted ATPase ExeA
MKVIRTSAQLEQLARSKQKAVLKLNPTAAQVTPPLTTKESMTTITSDDATAVPDRLMHSELRIKRIADRLKVGLRDLAAKGGIGVSTLHQIFTLNQWPKRTRVNRDAILDALSKAGATPDELATAWDTTPERPIQSGTQPRFPNHTRPVTGQRRKASANDASNPDSPQETTMLMGKQTLSMEARKQFALFSNPFDGEVSSEAEMFQSGEIRFIREACWQTAVNGSFVAVLGESGAGKTTILADLKERVEGSNRPVIMIEPSVLGMGNNDRVAKVIKSADILTAGILTLAPLSTMRATIEGRTRQFIKLLETSVSSGNNHMLVIEEAHDLPVVTLQHLKRLHERARIGRRSALGILLIGHPELEIKLKEVREVYQRCEVLHLRPLDHELHAYLAHKAEVAGKKLGDLITDDGIEAIRARLTIERRANNGQGVRVISLVYPLAVHNMVTAALNQAAALGAPIVDADIVMEL